MLLSPFRGAKNRDERGNHRDFKRGHRRPVGPAKQGIDPGGRDTAERASLSGLQLRHRGIRARREKEGRLSLRRGSANWGGNRSGNGQTRFTKLPDFTLE